jgi:hypothetical protein
MNAPSLAELLRWMAEMPVAFRAEPEGFPDGRARVRAVVADLFETFFGQSPPAATLAAFDHSDTGKAERNRLRWLLAATHLLWHPTFREHPPTRAALERLLIQELPAVAGIVDVEQLDQDEERREELVRRTLRTLARPLPGEAGNEAEDRWKQVDSVERRRVLLAAAERERRSRQVREAMARKAAQEAAAKVSRE